MKAIYRFLPLFVLLWFVYPLSAQEDITCPMVSSANTPVLTYTYQTDPDAEVEQFVSQIQAYPTINCWTK